MMTYKKLFIIFVVLFSSASQAFESFGSRPAFSRFSVTGLNSSDQEKFQSSASQALYRSGATQLNLLGQLNSHRFENIELHPYRYQRQEVGLSYRSQNQNSKNWSLSLNYGSASDQPFESSQVSTVSSNFSYQLSDRFYFIANYSNNRSFLNNIPLPSLLYIHRMEREQTVIIGVPFLLIRKPLWGNWSYQYSTLMPYIHRLQLSYRFNPFMQVSLKAAHNVDTYLRYERPDREQQVYVVERKAWISSSLFLSRSLELELNLGHYFASKLYEAKRYSAEPNFFYRTGHESFISGKLQFTFF